jgi:hypothetical protein
MKTKRFELRRVQYMPKELENGVLYVAEEFGAAAHLCACGCGEKIRTPLGPTEWRLEISNLGLSLSPSIGNWQKPCRSHYWISQGRVVWASDWTEGQVLAGRSAEEKRRRAYYESKDAEKVKRNGFWRCAWDALWSLFIRK